MSIRWFSLAAAVVLCEGILGAQAPIERDPTAIGALVDSLRAMGVLDNGGLVIQDAVAEGQLELASGAIGRVRIQNKGPKQLRYEFSLPEGLLTTVVNSGAGYRLKDGARENLPLWVTRYQAVLHIPGLSRMVDYSGANVRVLDLGTQFVNGRSARHVRLGARPGTDAGVVPSSDAEQRLEDLMSEFHVFIDITTKLPVKATTFLFSPEGIENRTTVHVFYDDYRQVQGVWVPHRVSRFVSDQKLDETVFTSVNFNVGLPDSLFEN